MSGVKPSTNRLTPRILISAYSTGIFPMSEARDAPSIFWVEPKMRAILPLDSFHIPQSLKKKVRNKKFEVTYNTNFRFVIEACANIPRQKKGTWINDEIISAYSDLHEIGLAHSIECRLNGNIVGGLYGVSINGVFCGESMFSQATDASKVALVHLVARMKYCQLQLLDTQFITDHLKKFGAIEISARDYLICLEKALKSNSRFRSRVSEKEDLISLGKLLSD